MTLHKNQRCLLTVDGYTAEGYGVGRSPEGMAVFVPQAIRSETVEVHIQKVQRTLAYGRIEAVLAPSPHRVTPDCPHFPRCGGCDFRHMDYEEELFLKARRVQDAFARIGGFALPQPEIVPSPRTERYRNKAVFPVGLENGLPVFGFYRSRSHQLIPIASCALQSEEATALAGAVCAWAAEQGVAVYQEEGHVGLLRHIFVRSGQGGIHLALVVTKDALPREDRLIALARQAAPALCGVVVNVNPKPGNRILGQTCRTLWGEDRLTDKLAGHTFRLSPLSFYQVNHDQTEQLYAHAVELAASGEEGDALDLYCGVGTITLALARQCRSVVGVELVPAAIDDARDNARRNGVSNVRFLCADAGEAAQALAKEGFRPQVILVDPPRKGLDEGAVDAICAMAPQRVVYVSCDCASLARDARRLAEKGGYQPQSVKAFDMFPKTANVETVCLLSKERSSR